MVEDNLYKWNYHKNNLTYFFAKDNLKIRIRRFKINVITFANSIGVDEILYP